MTLFGPPTRASILVLIALGMLLAACPAPAPAADATPAPEDETVQQIERTVALFFAGEDAEAICADALSEDYVEEVYGSVEECEAAQEDSNLGAVAVTEIDIEAGESAEAQAEPAGQATAIVYELEFVFEDGAYKIDAIDPPFPPELAAEPTEEPDEPTEEPDGEDVEERMLSLIPEPARDTCTAYSEPGTDEFGTLAVAGCSPWEADPDAPVTRLQYSLIDPREVSAWEEDFLARAPEGGFPEPTPGDCESEDNVIDESPPPPHGRGVVICLRVQDPGDDFPYYVIVWTDETLGVVGFLSSVDDADRDAFYDWWVENTGPVADEEN